MALKKIPIKLTTIALLIIILGLNCFGFCFEQMRFISDQERIDIVVQKIILNFVKPKPYKNLNEFYRHNPNCCQVVRSLEHSEGLAKVSLFGCLTGQAPYLVQVGYLVNYTDKGSVVKSAPVSGFYKISSCGEINDYLD